ncbi:AAA family ATPase [Campylobacter insulaenigrae]|uniref:AAA family ATPase n=1 Tax=Campylobacter insulaenigrae TaxID=260714 RepID=UPI002153622A|nr:AAA family ATPase [Campylobacter insulaenigrae]MCR6588429.1 AAA family ATPase [Campylobacter insulaenigrae]
MIISICNEKGGSGKSTLAVNLAIKAAESKKVLLCDSDPQKSVMTFVSIRMEEGINRTFSVVSKVGESLKDFIQKEKNKNEYDLIIIDTGGRDSKEMRIALGFSDVVIIPTIPSQFDVSVLDKMFTIIKMAKELNRDLQTFVLINKSSPNPFLNKKIEDLRAYIKEQEDDNIKLLDNIICEREKYKTCIQMGLGISETEINSSNKALEEFNTFYNELINKIKG